MEFDLLIEILRQGDEIMYQTVARNLEEPPVYSEKQLLQLNYALATTSPKLFSLECMGKRPYIRCPTWENRFDIVSVCIQIDDADRLDAILSYTFSLDITEGVDTRKYIFKSIPLCKPDSKVLPILVKYYKVPKNTYDRTPRLIAELQKMGVKQDIIDLIGSANSPSSA